MPALLQTLPVSSEAQRCPQNSVCLMGPLRLAAGTQPEHLTSKAGQGMKNLPKVTFKAIPGSDFLKVLGIPKTGTPWTAELPPEHRLRGLFICVFHVLSPAAVPFLPQVRYLRARISTRGINLLHSPLS